MLSIEIRVNGRPVGTVQAWREGRSHQQEQER